MQPRYQKLPCGSLFPVADTVDDLDENTFSLLCSTSFELDTSSTIPNIMSVKGPVRTCYTPIPNHYDNLVRRFIWRIDVLKELYFDRNNQTFTQEEGFGIACNMIYAVNVLKFCRSLFRAAVGEQTEVRIHFFDVYMLEDHYVGRHEPSAVILWQKEHPENNLRTDDVNALGV